MPSTGADAKPSVPKVLVEGHDFFAAPRLSPDGKQLAWIAWDHPNMPWDTTSLYVGMCERCLLYTSDAADD